MALLYVVEVGFEVEGGAARALFQVVDRILPFLHSSPIGNRYIALACLVSQIIYNLRGRVGCFGQHRFSGVTWENILGDREWKGGGESHSSYKNFKEHRNLKIYSKIISTNHITTFSSMLNAHRSENVWGWRCSAPHWPTWEQTCRSQRCSNRRLSWYTDAPGTPQRPFQTFNANGDSLIFKLSTYFI